MDGRANSLADVLERVLDKGVVIVGDIAVNVVDIELLTLRLRLFVASAQTAREMGMDWWTGDPFYTPHWSVESGRRCGCSRSRPCAPTQMCASRF